MDPLELAGRSELYQPELAGYRTGCEAIAAGVAWPSPRGEHQFEYLRDWSLMHTLERVKLWFEHQRTASG